MQHNEVPAGWYADPSGAPQSRWWNGVGWTDNVSAPAAVPAQQPIAALPAAPQSAHADSFMESLSLRRAPGWYPDHAVPGQERWWDGSVWTTQVSGGPSQPMSTTGDQAPAGTSPYNRQIWAIVGIYGAMSILGIGIVYWMFTNVSLMLDETAFIGVQLGLGAVGLAAWVITGFLAYSDEKDLASRGVPKPFGWAFVCIPSYGPTIYIIGRSVVVRRRTGSGMAPMWWHIGLYLGGGALSIVAGIVAFMSLVPQGY